MTSKQIERIDTKRPQWWVASENAAESSPEGMLFQ
jgi:hypothetical protein